MSFSRAYRPGRLLFVTDVLSIIAAYYTTLFIRFISPWGDQLFTWINRTLGVRETGAVDALFREFYVESAPRIIVQLILVLCTLYAFWNLYAARRFLRRRPVLWSIIVCNVIALAIFYAYFYLQRNQFHPRSIFACILLVNTVYAGALRALHDRILRHLRTSRGFDRWPVVIVGQNRDADRILDIIEDSPDRGLIPSEQLAQAEGEPFEALLDRVRHAVPGHGARLAILADARCTIGQIMEFLEMADELDIAVMILSREMDVLLTRARIESDLIHGIPLVHFAAPSTAAGYVRIKRAASAGLAVLAVLILAPVFLAVALLIRVTSRGPILFVQERIGVNHKPFAMYKFRTMIHRADEKLAELEKFNQSGAGLFKMRNDPRVTWIGQFLRRYSLDELPQLFNVVRGNMTLVGPRPLPRRDFENYYEDWHYGRHHGLPGLTCLWQVSGRSELDFHSMCILDVYYLRNQNWVMDLLILMRTVQAVLFAKGAY